MLVGGPRGERLGRRPVGEQLPDIGLCREPDSPAAPVGAAARETGGPNPALIGNGGQISAYATVKIVDIHWHY